MKQYRHLTQEGRDYHIRQPLGISAVYIVLFIFVGFALVFFSDFVKIGWTILVVLVIFFVLSRTTHRSSKKIIMQNGIPHHLEFQFAKFRAPIVYNVEDIRNLTLRKTYYAGVPVGAELLAELEVDEQLKTITLSQSMRAKMIQELYNEVEDLLKKSMP